MASFFYLGFVSTNPKYPRRKIAAKVLSICIRVFLVSAFAFLAVAKAPAQTPSQQRVYGSTPVNSATSVLPGYNKDSTTGALTVLSGAPFADRLEGGLLAIDGQGKFLFVLNPVSNNISMFQIDGSTGVLTEVPNSPFAAGPTINPNMGPSRPVSVATEKSGNFLYVGYANGDFSNGSAVVPFTIDSATLSLVLTAQLSMDFTNGSPIQMLTDPKGLRLYVGIGNAPYQSTPGAGTQVYSIDSVSGVLTPTGNAGGGSEEGRAIAIDPQGRFFFDSWGQNSGFIDSGTISPVDGTTGSNSSTLNLGPTIFANSLLVDSSGKYLYAQITGGLEIYGIDQVSGVLTPLNGPLPALDFQSGRAVADPMGPYVYSSGPAGVDVYQIDPQTGNLAEIPGAPFASGSTTTPGVGTLAISGAPTQNVSGPAAQLFPTSTDFGAMTVGQASGTKIVSLVNTGNQIMAVNGISIIGANAADFAQSSTCGATLTPNANCSISILFTPSHGGLEQASLSVLDNAAGSPQSAALTGTGIATTPEVTISPASVAFETVSQGASVPPMSVQITNSGTGALHISSIALSGSNPGDFSQSSNCVAAAIAAQAMCTITVNFAPTAQGQRTASLVVTDDAANSPQSIALSGTLASPFQLLPATGSATSATVSAGQPAQYALQLAPGAGFTGTVAFSCSGAPVAATCGVSPLTMSVTGAGVLPFKVNVTTSGSGVGARLPPAVLAPRMPWWPAAIELPMSGGLFLYFARWTGSRRRRVILCRAGFACAAILFASVSGCGGGSSSDPPPPAVTPPGTSFLIVTAKSGTLAPQTIQLTLTVN
jgi:6-phosphogluconolactonase (cycloisomerase 2 family)